MNSQDIMLGVDLSHHNWNGNPLNPSYLNFAFFKASEGKTWQDNRVNDYLQLIVDTVGAGESPFIGFYHYARPENGNTPHEEAQNFIATIEHHIGNCLIALDYEQRAFEYPKCDSWAYEWLKEVQAATGNLSVPLLYTSAAYTHKFIKTSVDFPLWVAHYGTPKPRVDSWKAPTIWQFTSRPFDINIFYGNPADMVSLINNGK